MINKSINKGKHFTEHDRVYIQDALNSQYSLKVIAEYLGKDTTTISKEVKRNRILKKRNSEILSSCSNRIDCTQKHLCDSDCKHLCKKCPKLNCYRMCPNYKKKACSRLLKFPHVCNGCEDKLTCKIDKFHYRAKFAEASYKDKLVNSREGIGLTQNELAHLDKLISPLVMKGQSIAHIYTNHKDEINCSERTLYNYFEMNLFSARNIDLPRKVRYKPRKKQPTIRKEQSFRIGRTYDDFNKYLEVNPGVGVVEMDTVYGVKGSKVLLTLMFRNCSLMIAILLEKCTQKCVNEAIEKIYADVGIDVFKRHLPVILTDNGSEFKDPEGIEYDCDGNERTKVFYCNPMASYQKPHVEKNHEYIRYIIPKGKSFDFLTQEKVTLMINHINSAARTSRNGNTPFKLAQLLLNDTLLETLSLVEIQPDDVHLKPALFKKTN